MLLPNLDPKMFIYNDGFGFYNHLWGSEVFISFARWGGKEVDASKKK